jgi:glycosyltransferase involved in cell wall biosynthesis
MSPTLSIITPSLDQASFLEAAIQSVLQQGCEELEYCVVDGGSKDASIEILTRHSSAVRWISEPDRGQADAVAKGIRMTRGGVLGWLNADDFYSPGALSEVARHFRTDPDLMLLYGNAHHVDELGNFLEAYPTCDFNLAALAYHCFICQPACFFRRSLLDAAGGLDTALQYAMDLDLWIRFGKLQQRNPHWKFRHIPEVLASSRMHSTNKTLSRRRESLEEIIRVVQRHFGVVPFNWVYGAEESASGSYDGFFRRSPFRPSLFGRSLGRWLWMNRTSPGYVMSSVVDRLLSPQQSLRSVTVRTGGRG